MPIPIIGMIHLPPLLGYPTSPGIEKAIEKALRDLKAMEEGGIDGIMVENEHDQPHKVIVGPETVAAMTIITDAVKKAAKRIVVGVEILLNDPKSSLAVARATDTTFIRTDYFVDKMARDDYDGEMAIDPIGLIEYRKTIQGEGIVILADIQVKYAKMLEEKTLAQSARQAKEQGADAIIVTGNLTGEAPIGDDLMEAKNAVGADYPVLIGSGLTAENAHTILAAIDGAIVGTSIKTGEDVDIIKVQALMHEVQKLRQQRL